jgi:hypothetical protein
MLAVKESNRFLKINAINWMLVSGDRHDIFSSERIGLTDNSAGSSLSFQICAAKIIVLSLYGRESTP